METQDPRADRETEPRKPQEVAEESLGDRFLDHLEDALDPRRDVVEVKETFKTPFVRKMLVALLVLIFLIFIMFFISFIFEIPLLHTEFMQHFTSAVVEIIKLFAI